ncbi:hypothetical protein BDP27DRAFT_1234044, partial [Rhodocollybia butyracea]
DGDVVVQSVDNVEIWLHQKNLECLIGSSRFPPADENDIVHLPKPAKVLEILFHAIYARPFPDARIMELQFESFMLLAEAAEKYQVYSMVAVCKLRMRHEKRLRLLKYASTHNHRDLIDELQLLLVNVPLSELVKILSVDDYKTWVKHLNNWKRIKFIHEFCFRAFIGRNFF